MINVQEADFVTRRTQQYYNFAITYMALRRINIYLIQDIITYKPMS